MRAIELYTATTDKHGMRREAGEVLHIGESDVADIAPVAAKALVARGAAVATKPEEPEADVEFTASADLSEDRSPSRAKGGK